MTKRAVLNFVLLVLLHSVLFTSAFSFDKKFYISFRGGYYSPSSSTLNNEALPPTNLELNETAAVLYSLGVNPEYEELDTIKGAFCFGGELEAIFWKGFSFSIGIESWKDSASGSTKFTGNIGDSFFSIAREADIVMSISPIYLTLKYSISLQRFRFYGGTGAGYYKSKIKLSSFSKSWSSYAATTQEIEARENALIPHISLGVDFNIITSLLISIDLKYVFGSIDRFEITKSTNDELILKELTFVDNNGFQLPFKWELTGPNIGILLRFVF